MPISSPMMNRMLGFLSAACATTATNAAHNATASLILSLCFMLFLSVMFELQLFVEIDPGAPILSQSPRHPVRRVYFIAADSCAFHRKRYQHYFWFRTLK